MRWFNNIIKYHVVSLTQKVYVVNALCRNLPEATAMENHFETKHLITS